MARPLISFYTFTLMILFIGMNAAAQVRVTGHVFAEVVETLGASSGTNNLLSLSQNSINSELDLGEIFINGGAMAAFSVVFENSKITGEYGTRMALRAGVADDVSSGMLDTNGREVLKIIAEADENLLNAHDKNYTGQYQVVFAYN